MGGVFSGAKIGPEGYYCDEDGNTIGTTDVFDRIEAAKKHFIKVGLGEEYVNQFIR